MARESQNRRGDAFDGSLTLRDACKRLLQLAFFRLQPLQLRLVAGKILPGRDPLRNGTDEDARITAKFGRRGPGTARWGMVGDIPSYQSQE